MASGLTDNIIDNTSQSLNVPQEEQDRTENCTVQAELGPENLRITVFGRTGEGKSSTLNTILGRPAFRVGNSPFSITNSSSYASCMYNGRRITVVDTPGIHSNTQAKSAIEKELKRTAILLPDGVHCFIICMNMSICRFDIETEEMLKAIKVFGDNVFNYCLLVYNTPETELEYGSLEDFLVRMKKLPQYQKFLQKINDRVIAVNNVTSETEKLAQNRHSIIEKIQNVVRVNKSLKRPEVFTNKLFAEAKRLHNKLPKDICHQSIANAVVEVILSTHFFLVLTSKRDRMASKVIETLEKCELCKITSTDFTFSNDGNCAKFDFKQCREDIKNICGKTTESFLKERYDILVGIAVGLLVFLIVISFLVIRGYVFLH